MTTTEKETVRRLRGAGLGYKAIASRLELSADAIKSFCHRSGLAASTTEPGPDACRQCGELLGEKRPGAEGKKFCSSACRTKWWNHNKDLQQPKEDNRRVCSHCRRVFYNAKARKYCGRPCYLVSRFGGERHDDGAV